MVSVSSHIDPIPKEISKRYMDHERLPLVIYICPPDTECEWWLTALTPVLLLVCVSLLLQLARLSVELLLLREPRLLRAVVLVS